MDEKTRIRGKEQKMRQRENKKQKIEKAKSREERETVGKGGEAGLLCGPL